MTSSARGVSAQSAGRLHGLLTASALLVAAVGVRLWDLAGKSLWRDEAMSVMFARQPLWQILTNVSETNPPLYYALLHAWIRWFGISEVALRSLSVVFGVVAVGLIGWVGAMVGGRRLGWVAMALMALMPMPVEYSQMARGYTLFLAASLGSFGCLMSWERTGRWPWAVAYVGSTLLMVYAHNYAVFNLLVQHLYMAARILQRRAPLGRWLAMSAAVAIGGMPWIAVLMSQTHQIQAEGFWLPRPGVHDLLETVASYVSFRAPMSFAAPCVILAAVGAVCLFRSSSAREEASRWTPGWLLVLWFAVPIVVPFVWSQIGTPILWPRYTIAAAAAFYLLVGTGLLAIPRHSGRVAVGILIVALTMGSLGKYFALEREAWRTVAAVVTDMAQATDAVAVPSHDSEQAFAYYYKGSVPFQVYALPFAADGRDDHQLDEFIDGVIPGHRRLWVVARVASSQLQPRRGIVEALTQRYPDARHFFEQKFPGRLFVYGYDLSALGARGE